jgi:4-amino-4-deoxy-L-arabinose transferase-like glycosyltransferase
MSAATRSTLRRVLSAFFFALAFALFLLAQKAASAQVYVQDPCKLVEPGSWQWYFLGCWIGSAVAYLKAIFRLTSTGMLIR